MVEFAATDVLRCPSSDDDSSSILRIGVGSLPELAVVTSFTSRSLPICIALGRRNWRIERFMYRRGFNVTKSAFSPSSMSSSASLRVFALRYRQSRPTMQQIAMPTRIHKNIQTPSLTICCVALCSLPCAKFWPSISRLSGSRLTSTIGGLG